MAEYDFYIKVDAGNQLMEPHPRSKENMKTVFSSYDFSSGPPDGFLGHVRVIPPALGVYEKFDETVGADIALAFSHNGLEYKLENGVYKDVWHVLPMTTEEKATKIAARQSEWASADLGWDSWTWNESICDYEPPVPYPDDGEVHIWDEDTRSWAVYSS
jgi:hypothetical protein|tara:strand:- start:368 stop:844 length:477 start_codon:yes stop_codon:yes gene_type:complete